jgi:rubrerythrin
MRVRPQRHPGRAPEQRRPHIIGRAAPAEPSETPTQEVVDDEHVAERRHRAAVNPEDHALYRCLCGYVFEADVTTTVACPHCGASQAW